MDIKVMGMLLFIVCTLFDSMFAFNQIGAKAECRGNGGLASYRHFVGDVGSSVDKGYDLEEGESAWISGYVKFSQFVAYHGCLSKLKEKNALRYTLKENNIYNCLQKCSEKVNISYIGLRNEFCYCTQSNELNNFLLQPDEYCYQEFINSNFILRKYVSLIKANITFYTIISYKRLTWNQTFSEAWGQCVKVRSDGYDVKYKTDSCYSNADSFICTGSAYHSSLNCGNQQLPYCNISVSNSWMTSFKECLEYKGKLISFVYREIKGYLKANESYWTGIFRSFEIVDKNLFSENNVCLTVKNVNGKLVLDPSDCSAKKETYICEGNFSKSIQSTSVETNVDTKAYSTKLSSSTVTSLVKHTTLKSATRIIPSKTLSPTQNESEDYKSNLISVYIPVGAVVAVALTIIIIFVILRKIKRSKATSSTKRSSSNDQDNAITDNTCDTSKADVTQKQVQAHHSVEEEVTYAIPDTIKKHSPSPESEYDRIHIKGSGERKENTTKAETIDDHVYGFHSAHPIDSGIEVYDHLEAVGKTNVSKPTDGIYNTLSEDSETYNVLRPGNKKESTKSSVNRTKIKETCPTYDKLK